MAGKYLHDYTLDYLLQFIKQYETPKFIMSDLLAAHDCKHHFSILYQLKSEDDLEKPMSREQHAKGIEKLRFSIPFACCSRDHWSRLTVRKLKAHIA